MTCPRRNKFPRQLRRGHPKSGRETTAGLPSIGVTAVTTLRDQLPNACADFSRPVLRPDGGEAGNRRVVEHEEPAEIEPPLSKIITSRGVPGRACAYVAAGSLDARTR